MFNKTENQTGKSREEQNPALSQDSENLEERIEKLNNNGKKSGKIIGIIILLICLCGIIAGGYYFRDDIVSLLNLKEETKEVDCALDTKECSDGSFVGRISPNCEFAKCTIVDEGKDCVKEGAEYLIEPIPVGSSRELCCAGLSGELAYTIINNKCNINNINKDIAVCINCPNGKCGLGENKCNCPQDCKGILDISDWQTYRDVEFGFEIGYPKNWEINKEKSDFTMSISDLPVLNKYTIGNEEEKLAVFVVILDNSANKSMNDFDWVDEDESEINKRIEEIEIVIPKTNFQINNLEAIKQGIHSKLLFSGIDVTISLSPEKIVSLRFSW